MSLKRKADEADGPSSTSAKDAAEQILDLVRSEHGSSNSDFYRLFGMTPSSFGQPLSDEDIASLKQKGEGYIRILNEFVENAGQTLLNPETKIAYDKERMRQTQYELNNGGEGMHIDQDSVGEESDDDDRMSDDDSGPEEGLLAKLPGLYSEAGPILKEYLSKPDDPNKSAQQIMIEPYEPLDKFNERITQELGKKHGRGFTIKYTLLKTYSRDILQLKNDIEEADGPVKETLQNKFSVLVNKIWKYVRTNQLPDDWATLLGVEAPGPSFDIERDSSWDEP
ncbi:uncharacterized protein JN550_013915, partial [Neoarthrinium moseri]